VIYSVGKAVGGILKASDDISEVKFVSLAELSDLPLTPLVRRVLMDAGYIPSETTAVSRIVTQEELPLLIAGAMVGLTARSGGARRGARRRTRTSLSESLLLFDNNASE
jgi:hypothetical protein